MKRSKMIWGIVAVLAVATFLTVAVAIAKVRNVQDVVVAKRVLSVGQRVTTDDVTVQQVAASAILPGAYSTVEEVLGQTVAVARVPGDQLTASTLGDAENPLTTALPPDWRAVGVTVNDAEGLVGLLKPGDTVGVIAYLEPEQRTMVNLVGEQPEQPTYEREQSPQARITLEGLKVLFVPQEFRYVEDVPAGAEGEQGGGLGGNTLSGGISRRRERSGVVVLAAPATLVSMTVPLGKLATTMTTMTDTEESMTLVPVENMAVVPVELLALLDDSQNASIHLVLEPEDAEPAVTLGVTINDLLMIRRQGVAVEEVQP